MTNTQRNRDSRTTSLRTALRQEVAGTIGLLADEQDFTAMRRYRSFTFDDHKTYLRQVEGLLKSLAAKGGHTTVALFDPEEYEEFCAETGLEPDTPASRTRFTAELATVGPAIAYEGQPLDDLLPELVDEAVRQATWQYASTTLSHIGPCAGCGQDIGRTAFARASYLIARAVDTVGPGAHHWVGSVPTTQGMLHAVLHVDATEPGTVTLDETEAMELTTLLALAIAHGNACALVVRTTTEEGQRIYGWRLKDERLEPLPAARVFDAYCNDTESGDLTAPEPGVDYCTAPDIADTGPTSPHCH
ncbi:hypothetical protein [Streptomyces sp. NPDC050145]|uniref:hypothetical protein n=1 Tax=Streptomyces sp. NPDC050145 TaxID=3365602 RepID=UPI0037AD1C26